MGRTTKEAYEYIKKAADDFIYSASWDGSQKQIELQAVKIAADATKYDTNPQHNLYKIALTTLETYAKDRNDFENEILLLQESHEFGGCSDREFRDYGLCVDLEEVVQYD